VKLPRLKTTHGWLAIQLAGLVAAMVGVFLLAGTATGLIVSGFACAVVAEMRT
jgi:hypothetical protein